MVTARLSVLQHEKTFDTLRYIARKAPFHRENESASILAFLDDIAKDFPVPTYLQQVKQYRTVNDDAIESHDAVSQEGFNGTGVSNHDNSYDRNETVHTDES